MSFLKIIYLPFYPTSQLFYQALKKYDWTPCQNHRALHIDQLPKFQRDLIFH